MFRAFVVSAVVKVVRTTSCHPRAQNGTRPWQGRQQAHLVPDSGDISIKNTALGLNRQAPASNEKWDKGSSLAELSRHANYRHRAHRRWTDFAGGGRDQLYDEGESRRPRAH